MATNESNEILRHMYASIIEEHLRTSIPFLEAVMFEQAVTQALLACTVTNREDPLLKHYYFYHPDDEPETITFEVI